jgi:hypothetical protein
MDIEHSTELLLGALERNKDRLLSLREVMDLVPALGEAEVRAALEGLVTGKRVDHPATDLYWCGTMTRLGPVPASAFAVVMKVYEGVGGVGRAGLDAINHMHLSTQMTAREMYAVPFLVEGIHVGALRLVDRSDRPARSGLGFFEVTLLETLGESDSWEVGAGPGLTRLTQVVARSGVTLDKEALVRGAADEPESAQELLGELLHIVA